MKKLLIDCTYFNPFSPMSIELYTCSLLNGFKSQGDFEVMVLVYKGQEAKIDEYVGWRVPKIVIAKDSTVTPWPALDRLLGLISFKQELERYGIDIVLTTWHFECRFFFPKKYHQHAIVHDLIPYHLMKGVMGPIKYFCWRLYRKCLINNISNYISISDGTREELKKMEGVDSVVVHNSIRFDFSIKETPVEEVAGIPFILDVNKYAKYKNAEMLICAFALIKDKVPHVLYLKGNMHPASDYENLKSIVLSLGLEDRVILDVAFRSDEEMRYLYTHADLFVSPSLYEGFGWTPIEAAILKTPVLVSDIAILREVTCGRIPTFNFRSTKDLAAKMHHLLTNPPGEKELEELSVFYLERYSPKRQIDELTRILMRDLED